MTTDISITADDAYALRHADESYILYADDEYHIVCMLRGSFSAFPKIRTKREQEVFSDRFDYGGDDMVRRLMVDGRITNYGDGEVGRCYTSERTSGWRQNVKAGDRLCVEFIADNTSGRTRETGQAQDEIHVHVVDGKTGRTKAVHFVNSLTTDADSPSRICAVSK